MTIPSCARLAPASRTRSNTSRTTCSHRRRRTLYACAARSPPRRSLPRSPIARSSSPIPLHFSSRPGRSASPPVLRQSPDSIDAPPLSGADDGTDSGEQVGPQSKRKPPVTLRYVAVGRSSHSPGVVVCRRAEWAPAQLPVSGKANLLGHYPTSGSHHTICSKSCGDPSSGARDRQGAILHKRRHTCSRATTRRFVAVVKRQSGTASLRFHPGAAGSSVLSGIRLAACRRDQEAWAIRTAASLHSRSCALATSVTMTLRKTKPLR